MNVPQGGVYENWEEMTILFEHNIPRFQERSAELQIPPRQAGTGRLRSEAVTF